MPFGAFLIPMEDTLQNTIPNYEIGRCGTTFYNGQTVYVCKVKILTGYEIQLRLVSNPGQIVERFYPDSEWVADTTIYGLLNRDE